jgi:tetrahydromethanopterin S-methyltransferase subunit B
MSDFFNDFFKGFIVGLGVSGAIYLVVELTKYRKEKK